MHGLCYGFVLWEGLSKSCVVGAQFALLDTVREWSDVHEYTLQIIIHIALWTNGGVAHNLASRDKAMVVTLESVPNGGGDSIHISRAYRVFDVKIARRDEDPFLRRYWREEQAPNSEARAHNTGQEPRHPALAGTMHVALTIRGTAFALQFPEYDIYRPYMHTAEAIPPQFFCSAFKDLDVVCRRAIAAGIVLSISDDPAGNFLALPPPDFGIYERDGSGWKKVLNPTMVSDVINPDMARHPSKFVSGLPFQALWVLLGKW
ncbi:hypothetical protein GSI_07308 [Ganoderma sinense ZZ0214-1]|uniref:Uncharacterized protein n=1 Tax=Ganoderma sinense ZZ0214-1 TaxID=1077348 RepID=A0A2G8SA31_9APHY|nr:hypothetical protein GSI_07308 [Ganoderma sinense ZZ0214-1]